MPDHEIFYSRANCISAVYSEDSIKIRDASESTGYGIRVLDKNRIGFSYCAEENEIKKAIEKAQGLAAFSPKTKFSFPSKQKYKSIDCTDKKIISSDETLLKEIIYEIKSSIEKSNAKPRVYASFATDDTKIENTKGMDCSYQKTMVSIFAEAMLGDGYGFCKDEIGRAHV